MYHPTIIDIIERWSFKNNCKLFLTLGQIFNFQLYITHKIIVTYQNPDVTILMFDIIFMVQPNQAFLKNQGKLQIPVKIKTYESLVGR